LLLDKEFGLQSLSLKEGLAEFEISLENLGYPWGIHNPQKNPAAVTGCPENSFISGGETIKPTHLGETTNATLYKWVVVSPP